MPSFRRAEDFAAAITDYAHKTVQSIAKDVASDLFVSVATNIIEATPILTGRARANWQASSGNPIDYQSLDSYSSATETGAPLTSDEQQSLNDAVEDFKSSSDTIIYLNNNLTYIAVLDAGSSLKAPAGIVEPSINAALDEITLSQK